jgi:hypothetical protein
MPKRLSKRLSKRMVLCYESAFFAFIISDQRLVFLQKLPSSPLAHGQSRSRIPILILCLSIERT